MRTLKRIISKLSNNEAFLLLLEESEKLVSKILAVGLLIVILVALFNLAIALGQLLYISTKDPISFFDQKMLKIFGLFLDLLIALELLENVTVYLRKHIIQIELVIVTAFIAVARKIIIFDFDKYTFRELIGLGITIFCISIAYCLVKLFNK